MNHVVCHFEIPAIDLEKMKEFYEKLFGWTFQKAEGMDYYAINTGGDPGGGMGPKRVPQAAPYNYISVENVKEFEEKLTALGGTVIVPRAPIPGTGYIAAAIDPEGNPFGLFESDPKAK